MKINLDKRQKITLMAIGILIVFIFVLLTLDTKSSSNKAIAADRQRRKQIPKSELTSSTLTSSPTTTKAVSADNPVALPTTDFIAGSTYKDAATIQSIYSEAILCSILTLEDAQKMLEMTTAPTPKYFFSQTQGVKCTYNNGEGDEILIQFSSTTFSSARTIDSALNETADNIILSNGAYGVAKKSKTDGYIISLNLFGVDLNEVLISAPTEQIAKNVAVTVSNYLKANPR